MTWLLYLFLGLVIGGAAGFFITRHYFQEQLKKNPPISEKQIRTMFREMGQKPSESRVQQVLKSMGIQPTNTKEKNK